MKKNVLLLSLSAVFAVLAQTTTPTAPQQTPGQARPGAPVNPATPNPNNPNPNPNQNPSQVPGGTGDLSTVAPGNLELLLVNLQADIEQALPVLASITSSAGVNPAVTGQAAVPQTRPLPPTGNPNQRTPAPGQQAVAPGQLAMNAQTIQLLAILQRNLQQTLPVLQTLNSPRLRTNQPTGSTNRFLPVPTPPAQNPATPNTPQPGQPVTPQQPQAAPR